MNQSRPRTFRTFATATVLIVLALVAFAVASAVSHHGRFNGPVARFLPAANAQPAMGHGRMGHRGGGAFLGGGGGGGTITQISGSTLTLRTMQGTETVNTSSTTTYTKERQTITFGDLAVGEVVRVVPAPGQARPATPGTGTITASRVMVVEPRLLGRVTGIDGDTVNMVGRDGQELSVTLTGSTKFLNGMQSADRSAVTVGSRILAVGSQDSLTHLTADVVTVLPAAGGRGHMWRGGRAHIAPGAGAAGPAVFGRGFGA